MLNSVAPFFIVDDLAATLDFYQSRLGFSVLHKGGGDGNDGNDFWAMVGRDQVMLMFKAITLTSILSPTIPATNGRAGTPGSTRAPPTTSTQSSLPKMFPSIANWPTPTTD